MTTVDYPVYDFVTASKVERPLSAALRVWLDKFSKTFVEGWKEFAPNDIKIAVLPIEAVSFESIQNKWASPSVGVSISINKGAVPGMIVAKRVDVLMLLMDILSETLTEKPADRELTSVETSLCQLMFEQSVASFGESWPDKNILPVELGPLDWLPSRSRMFPPKQELLLTGFDIFTASSDAAGSVRMQWVFAKDEMKKLLNVQAVPKKTATNVARIPAENISQIIVEVCASLGSTELDMHELMQLNVGDIVKLDQRIEQPIILLVNEHPALKAWPGRNGDNRCFQVESVIS